MKELNAFDFEPDHQPYDEPVSFRLKPLGMRGRLEIKSAIHAQEYLQAYQIAMRHVVGWNGNGLGEFSRARVKQIIDGGADGNWEIWIVLIAQRLIEQSQLEAEAAKKS